MTACSTIGDATSVVVDLFGTTAGIWTPACISLGSTFHGLLPACVNVAPSIDAWAMLTGSDPAFGIAAGHGAWSACQLATEGAARLADTWQDAVSEWTAVEHTLRTAHPHDLVHELQAIGF